MPDMGYIPPIQNFTLPGPAQINQQPGLVEGFASGVEAGAKLGQKQQELTLEQQKQQTEIQKMNFDKGISLAHNALDAYDHYGDVMGEVSLSAFQKGMNMAAPGSVDPNIKWDESLSGHMKDFKAAMDAGVAGKRPWPEVLGVMSMIQASAGKVQREKMQSVMDSAKDIYGQEQTTKRQEVSQGVETQRAYAEHAQPLIQAGSVLNSISNMLAKNDPTSDALAKANIEKLVANGTISKEDVDKLTSAGGPLAKIGQHMSNWWTGKTFDSTHRKAMQAWIPAKVAELNHTLQSTATAFPGAQPVNVRLDRDQKAIDAAKAWLKANPNDPMTRSVQTKLDQMENP